MLRIRLSDIGGLCPLSFYIHSLSYMIRKLIAVAAITVGCWNPAPVQAASAADIRELVGLIKGTGTQVVHDDCSKDLPGVFGFYAIDKEKNVDALVICSNRVDMDDANAVWDTLSHEATHVMQACHGGTIIKLEKHPAVLRELQDSAPHLYQTLQMYTGRDKLIEAEAFWMMLRSPTVVKTWFKSFCYSKQ